MKRLFLLLAVFPLCFGQSVPPRFSSSTGKVVLSGGGTTFTVQQAATGSKKIQLETVTVYCSVACEVSQAENGTAATSTAGTVTCIQPCGPSATATTWTASNVGTGTAVGMAPLPIPATGVVVLDLSKVSFAKTTTSATNYSVSINSITGTVIITYIWSEQQ